MTNRQAASWLSQPGIQAAIHDPHTKEAIRTAIKALSADRPRGEWVNIEEEPPIDSESVAVSVYFPDYGDTILAIGHYSPRFDQWRLYSDREGEIRSGYRVIAWMPLPEPYEEREGE